MSIRDSFIFYQANSAATLADTCCRVALTAATYIRTHTLKTNTFHLLVISLGFLRLLSSLTALWAASCSSRLQHVAKVPHLCVYMCVFVLRIVLCCTCCMCVHMCMYMCVEHINYQSSLGKSASQPKKPSSTV